MVWSIYRVSNHYERSAPIDKNPSNKVKIQVEDLHHSSHRNKT